MALGSKNPAKVDAVRRVFERAFKTTVVVPRQVDSGVPDQPRGADVILQGAVHRARACLTVAEPYGVGIEAGLVEQPDGAWFDVQYCAIVDQTGEVTVGHGPGFRYPPEVLEAVEAGEEVNDVMSRISGVEDVGSKMGAIGYLTEGHVDRTWLTESAVWMALVPRIREELYGDGEGDEAGEQGEQDGDEAGKEDVG